MCASPVHGGGHRAFLHRDHGSLGEDALVKVGAEGVYCAAFPKQGLGVALKIDDGTQRGAEVAMGAILRQHGVIDDARAETLKNYLTPVLTNWAGKYAGDLRPAF